MFDLVADVESYPAFLPGCTDSCVHSRSVNEVVASIAVAKGPLKTEFRTRNTLVDGRRIVMELEKGPFSELNGSWEFTPLGEEGCRVGLAIRFSFDSRAADVLLGPAFEAICNGLVDAFVIRAREIYA
nr:Polyketide cyclase / dehydrase and lipid transport [uncultured bacterium]